MSSMDVNLADLIGAVADALPDRCALVCDGDRLSYRQLMDRASQLAQHLIAAGLRPDETAGLYMPNSAAYVESLLACMLARLIPVNINYRYTGNELAHLFTAGKLAGLIVDAQYAPLAAAVAAGSPDLRHVLSQGEDGQRRVVHRGNVTVLDEALRPVGPGGIGQIARSGHVPLGYYGDEAATKATFPVIGGVRWALLGDMAEVDRDSSIIFLGRGSMCINTGGEKVYPRGSRAGAQSASRGHGRPRGRDTGRAVRRAGRRRRGAAPRRCGRYGRVAGALPGTLAGYKVPARIRFVAQGRAPLPGKPITAGRVPYWPDRNRHLPGHRDPPQTAITASSLRLLAVVRPGHPQAGGRFSNRGRAHFRGRP